MQDRVSLLLPFFRLLFSASPQCRYHLLPSSSSPHRHTRPSRLSGRHEDRRDRQTGLGELGVISSSRTVDGVKEEKEREGERKGKKRKRKEEGSKERNTVGESGSKACTAVNAQPLPNLHAHPGSAVLLSRLTICLCQASSCREYTSTACAPAFCLLLRT
ncbi:hypothetical protein BJ166DRAFT_44072 [Pestalotiopsis sp. NC0098]|nr:hypothetical protein BJ166DRAFT_44072 [Pestalotiopsis sp. NC0098]